MTKVEKHFYYSLEEFADVARKITPEQERSISGHFQLPPVAECADMARDGWEEGLQEAMPIVETALTLTEQERPHLTFRAEYDVSGSEVDVSRYLTGVPENMIEYEPITVSRVGRIITLCASISASGAVSNSALMRRGASIVALALALEGTGHECEIWIDQSSQSEPYVKTPKHRSNTKVCVKGAHDVVDPSRIAFACAHPAMLRRLGFAEMWSYSARFKEELNVGNNYGYPAHPIEDLPEGTIYLPSITSDHDVPDAEKFVLDTLKDIGLISADA